MLGVKIPAHEVFVTIDYSHDLGDNLNVLMDKLLEKYPQLTDRFSMSTWKIRIQKMAQTLYYQTLFVPLWMNQNSI